MGAAQSLAINGHMPPLQRAAPALKQLQHRLRPQHHEDLAEHVMGGCPVLKSHEAAQPGRLRLGEVLHVREAVAIAEDGAEGADQHLIETMKDLAGLAGVWHAAKGFTQTTHNAKLFLTDDDDRGGLRMGFHQQPHHPG